MEDNIDEEVADWKDLVPEPLERVEADPPYPRTDPEKLCWAVKGLSPALKEGMAIVLGYKAKPIPPG